MKIYCRVLFTALLALCFGIGVSIPDAIAEADTDSDRIIEEPPDDRAEARDLLTRKFLWSRDYTTVGVDQYGHAVSRQTDTVFYEGRHGRPLEGVEFYETIRRPDLVAEFRSRRRLNIGLITGGIIGTVVGPLVFGGGMAGWLSRTGGEEFDNLYVPVMIGGGVLSLAAPIVMVVGMRRGHHPIEPHERRELAEEYNFRLIEELDLNREDIPDAPDDGAGADDLRVDFFLTPHEEAVAAGIVVGSRF